MAIEIKIIGLTSIPEIREGDSIGDLIVEAAVREGVGIRNGDIIVVTQKIVSKSQGRILDLTEIKPSIRAKIISDLTGKPAELVEAILVDAVKVLKIMRGMIITLTKHGIACANSGVDASNISPTGTRVSLLPENPAREAEKIRRRIMELTGKKVAVIISDTYGRPLREGVVNMAVSVAGLKPFKDYRGRKDRVGYTMRVTVVSIADELCGAAELVMGQGDEGIPVVIIRGLKADLNNEVYTEELNMPMEKWLFT